MADHLMSGFAPVARTAREVREKSEAGAGAFGRGSKKAREVAQGTMRRVGKRVWWDKKCGEIGGTAAKA